MLKKFSTLLILLNTLCRASDRDLITMDHECYVVCFQYGHTVIRFRCAGEIRYLILCYVYNNNNILYEHVAQGGSGDEEKAVSVSGYT